MNKINHHCIGDKEFSPWEESFLNLAKSFDSNKVESPLKRHYLTIDTCKKHNEHLSYRKKELNRTFVTMSKINLQSISGNSNDEGPQLIKIESRRYEGPRLTFYSKMNPKCTEGSKFKLKQIDHLYEQRSFLEPRSRMIRDESINYLNILDQSTQIQKNKQMKGYLRSIFPSNRNKGEAYVSHKLGEDHHNMKRLKILYNSRKYSKH